MSNYQTMTHKMFTCLNKGVVNLAQFMRDLRNGYDEPILDVTFIENKLFPSVDQANADVRKMIEIATDLVKEINSEVEKNVDDLKRKKDEVEKLEQELKQLGEEKKGNENSLNYAENQVRAKENDLQKENQALEDARTKLNAGQEERRKAQLAASILWAIPIIGWIGASIATIVDCTALKQSVEVCEEAVQSAHSEYSNSTDALTRARNQVFEVNQKISSFENIRKNKESRLKTLNIIVEKLKEYQRLYTSLSEDVENLDQVLVLFYGKVKVMASETDGGYSIDVLRSPAVEIIKALSKLMQSDIMKFVGGAETKDIWKYLIEMEAIKWPLFEI